ncbi:MAG: hypothetical protein WKG07_18645 [Hymenobacter sp.]
MCVPTTLGPAGGAGVGVGMKIGRAGTFPTPVYSFPSTPTPSPMQNLFATPIPPAILAEALTYAQQAATLLQPYLTPLTPDERQNMLKMGPASVDFVGKARRYAEQNPAYRPAYLNYDEFAADADALAGLAPLHQLLGSLDLDTDSTMMTAGSDAYQEALQVYNYVKILAQNATPGAQAAYDDLRQSLPIASARRKSTVVAKG